MTTHAELADLLALVARMRAAQREYFSSRSKRALVLSCELEKKVDKRLEELLGGQQQQLPLGE